MFLTFRMLTSVNFTWLSLKFKKKIVGEKKIRHFIKNDFSDTLQTVGKYTS